MAHVFALALGLEHGIAVVAHGPAVVLDESQVSKLLVALRASEALGVPVLVHRLDHSANYELICKHKPLG